MGSKSTQTVYNRFTPLFPCPLNFTPPSKSCSSGVTDMQHHRCSQRTELSFCVLPLKDRKILGVERGSLGGGSPADDKVSRASSQHSLSHNIVVPSVCEQGRRRVSEAAEEDGVSGGGGGLGGGVSRGRSSDNEPKLPLHRPKTREACMHTTSCG